VAVAVAAVKVAMAECCHYRLAAFAAARIAAIPH
jgi:hypothetical protein